MAFNEIKNGTVDMVEFRGKIEADGAIAIMQFAQHDGKMARYVLRGKLIGKLGEGTFQTIETKCKGTFKLWRN